MTQKNRKQAVETEPGPLDARALKEAKVFTIVLDDGKGMQASLVEVDTYNVLVESNGRKILVPKHSVKYYVLPYS